MLLSSITASAYDFEVDGIYYNIVSETESLVEVTSGDNEYSGNVTIPQTVTSNNKSYTVRYIGYYAFKYCKDLTNVTIPNSVTAIAYEAFYNCSNITNITIPNSVTVIDSKAFCDCSSLTSIEIPNSVTSIGNKAFMNCSGLTSIALPEGITSIADHTFAYCSSITSITIPDSVTTINNDAFRYCTGLISINVGNSVEAIEQSAFYGCNNLTNITFPDAITRIEYNSFGGCSSLSSVIIPESMKYIGGNAFYDCVSLKSIVCKSATPPTISNSAFTNVPASTILYIPIGCKEAYANSDVWGYFTKIEEIEFAAETTITIMDASNQGSVSFNYENGKEFNFVITPVTGYMVNTVLVNGEIWEIENGKCRIEAINKKTTISVSYEADSSTKMENLSASDIKVYGYQNTLTVLGAEKGDDIRVFDMNGKLITSKEANGNNDYIPLNNDGIYIVKVHNKSFKIII